MRAAFEIMVDEGISGVKIHRLCERLGVTKGSFYWHFEDLDAFKTELARRWAEQRASRAGQSELSDDPEKAMLRGMEAFADRRNRNLTRAMRDWGQNDERARAAIREADQASLRRITQAIAAVGFSDEEAEVRAKILYYAGVGYAHVGNLGKRQSAGDEVATTWRILTRR